MDSTQVSANQVAAVFGMQPVVLAVVSFLIMAVTAWVKQNITKITGWWLLIVPAILGQVFAWLLPGPLPAIARIRIGVICAVGATAIWGLLQGVMSEYAKTKNTTNNGS